MDRDGLVTVATAACTARVHGKVHGYGHGRLHGRVHDDMWKTTRPSMQCMSAWADGCPALMLRVASQWATSADLGISSQIVICLLFACDYLRYIVLHLCITQRAGEYRINCISLLILSIYSVSHRMINSALQIISPPDAV